MLSFAKSNVQRAIPAAVFVTVVLGAQAQAGSIQDVFVISMENHNWTQPASQSNPQQIFGNPAAPYINSLVTPGTPNAALTSFANNYQNSGVGISPVRTELHLGRSRVESRRPQ